MLDLIGLKEVSTADFDNVDCYDNGPGEHHSSDTEERAEAVPVDRLGQRFDGIVEKGCVYADLPRICSAPLGVVFSCWERCGAQVSF